MPEERNVPQIRFKGFTDPWEQRQLGEVCTFRKGQGYSKADVSDKGTPILLYGRLYTHYQTCIRGIDTYADERADSVISRGGEVLVPASGESAEEIAVAASLDRPGVILGGDLNVATPSGVLKPEFLAYGITYGPAHQDLAMRAQGKSVVHVHNSDIAEVQICYPVPDEQNLFSTLFIRLDSLIALHQRKLDKLTNVKKSLLEKMFPKPGSDVPEIRFAGFTAPWEQRQFRNLAQRLSTAVIGNILPAVEYQDLVSGTGELKTDYRSLLRGKTGVFFSPGDVLYGKLRPYLHNWFLPGFEGVAVGDFWVLRPQEVDSEFLYRLVQSEEFDKIANQSSGTKMPRADWNLVGQSEFRVARSGTEQEKIGVVFSALDRLISLHQRKLDMLENVKKSLLEKMFV
ncbi:restriction endonuclease subunit S [Trueperella bernardiae]|uniref:restriction endonuclease subunit S n=1 Tax=Trueperella bernardiae TaxID=59561 RepID=UPI0023F37081|nr:restriction endonuclease subunit S [Trueperella bernardiae]